jgi:hypothetical protein
MGRKVNIREIWNKRNSGKSGWNRKKHREGRKIRFSWSIYNNKGRMGKDLGKSF